ncbi:aminotransferase class I/II-fold pyridoxal phosphate-dependent enzyme [Sphingobacterium phlebotomi]|uniref:Aminotransferase class I/II-fold pyridoxal phosphate-dependent enzyme n=1 Tax=Sphingobacterium phlebotomi TaxID=2605433 RepID=A0A5D4HB42_9SPHI|nr:methionine aminotransferase [Sphingobacterium phlebotomi]TYR37784.1 aminotransferase class I/II-fold pyridoxal phosphate-dependent enzyme [Sphingobacterium phlebotomi]
MTESFQSVKFSSKLPKTEVSIFSRMSTLAQQHQAINLSQGFPNYPVSERLISLVEQYMRKGFNQYAPMPGILVLRETIAEKIASLYAVDVDANDEITITSGGTQALFTAIGTVIKPGDETIIFEPAYDSYKPTVELFGGNVVPIRLKAPDFSIDWAEVKSRISERTRLIILNNPTNPSAKIWKKQDFEMLEKLVKDTSIIILSDEVYEHMVYDGLQHCSVLQFPRLRERSFVVASFGKLLHTTGWKLGYAVAPKYFTEEFRKIHQFNVFSSNTPVQFAVADYIKDKSTYLELNAFFQKKRDLMLTGLKASRFKGIPCEGTYFLLIDYAQISDAAELAYAIQLIRQFKVATVPVSAFYSTFFDQNLLRICFAKDDDTLDQSLAILTKL